MDACHDDLAPESRVPVQRRRHEHAPLLVELRVGRGAEEEPLQLSRLFRKRVEGREPCLDERVPVRAREHVEALVQASREHDAAGQRLAETSRQREPVLVVDGVFVLAEEHGCTRSWFPTFPHFKPRSPTCLPTAASIHPFGAGPSRARESPAWPRSSSNRALNRATLARQLLLERDAAGAARGRRAPRRHAGAGAAQPLHALWSRLEGFRPESLSELLERRELVRIGVMRGTIHLVTADDCLLLRPLMQPVLEAQLRRHGEHAPVARGRRPGAGGRRSRGPSSRSSRGAGPSCARSSRSGSPTSTRPRSRTPARSGSDSCRCRRAGSGAGARRCARRRRSRGSAGRSPPSPRSTRSCCATSLRSARPRSPT